MTSLRDDLHTVASYLKYLRTPLEQGYSNTKASQSISDIDTFSELLQKIAPDLLESEYKGNDWEFLSGLCFRALDNLKAFHTRKNTSVSDAYISYYYIHQHVEDICDALVRG